MSTEAKLDLPNGLYWAKISSSAGGGWELVEVCDNAIYAMAWDCQISRETYTEFVAALLLDPDGRPYYG